MRPGLPIIAAALAFAAVACGGSGAPRQAPATLRFAVIPKSLDLPVFNYAKIGAEREAKALGGIEVIWRGPENADQLRQKEILESFITQHVDGIAISCLNGDFLTETIDKAVDAGIPVVTWDSDAPTLEAPRVLRRRRPRRRPHHGRSRRRTCSAARARSRSSRASARPISSGASPACARCSRSIRP